MTLKTACKRAMIGPVTDYDAYLIRENTGTTGLERTAQALWPPHWRTTIFPT